MGQYFTPTFLNTAGQIVAALNPEEYGSGLKLFGHTRADNRLMFAVQTVLSLDGGLRLAWAGDYAEPEPGQDANLYFLIEDRHFVRFEGLVCPDVEPNRELPQTKAGIFGYLCNSDKHEYIENLTLQLDVDGCRRTPLPLLTAEYGTPEFGASTRDLGSWARDRIYYTETSPGLDWTPAPSCYG